MAEVLHRSRIVQCYNLFSNTSEKTPEIIKIHRAESEEEHSGYILLMKRLTFEK